MIQTERERKAAAAMLQQDLDTLRAAGLTVRPLTGAGGHVVRWQVSAPGMMNRYASELVVATMAARLGRGCSLPDALEALDWEARLALEAREG